MKYFISYNGKVGLGHFFGCIDVSLNKLTVNNTDEWFSSNRVITSNWVTYWWFLEHHKDFEKNMNVQKQDLVRLENIKEISELKDYYEEGYEFIILDYHNCFQIEIKDQLVAVPPVKVIPNDVAMYDPLLFNHFQQQPYLAKSDVKRHRIGTCDREAYYFKNILIYNIKEVLDYYNH